MLKLSKLQILRLQNHKNWISRKMARTLPNFHTVYVCLTEKEEMLLRNIGLFLAFLTSSGAFAGSQRLLGAEKCTWGPSYWCQGLKESSECSATKHCIRKYWDSNPQKYQGDDDDVCTICKNMVKEARDTLQSNQTQVLFTLKNEKFTLSHVKSKLFRTINFFVTLLEHDFKNFLTKECECKFP